MDGLTEKTYEQRLEGGEGVSSHLEEESKKVGERARAEFQNMGRAASASEQKERGMFKRRTPR